MQSGVIGARNIGATLTQKLSAIEREACRAHGVRRYGTNQVHQFKIITEL